MHCNTPEKPRKTQLERSDEMRLRLIAATMECIAQWGYAGATVSNIIERAGTSRGAFVHHFPNKALLIEATTEHLTRSLYGQLGRTIVDLLDADDRLGMLMESSFNTLVGSLEFAVFQELLTASRTDPDLLALMQRLSVSFVDMLTTATRHYLEPRAQGENAEDLIVLTQWVLRGMATDHHLTADGSYLKRYFEVWVRVLRTQIKAKPGVKTPPPKPGFWSGALGRKV